MNVRTCFTVDAGSGAHRQLTQGRYEVRHATWSADGESLYYTRTREGRMAHRTDIWTLRRDGTDARQLTHEVAIVQDPVPSPDGKRIAFAGSECGGDSQTRLWCLDLGTGGVSGLGSADIEVVSGKSLHWSAASDAVETIAARNGLQEVARIDAASGRTETVLSGLRHISAMSRAGDTLYFVAESIGEPGQLHVWDAGSGEERQLTALNAWWYERCLPEVRYEPFVVKSDAGGEETVWAWVIRSAQPHTGAVADRLSWRAGELRAAVVRITPVLEHPVVARVDDRGRQRRGFEQLRPRIQRQAARPVG